MLIKIATILVFITVIFMVAVTACQAHDHDQSQGQGHLYGEMSIKLCALFNF